MEIDDVNISYMYFNYRREWSPVWGAEQPVSRQVFEEKVVPAALALMVILEEAVANGIIPS